MPSNYPKFPINLGAYTDIELANLKDAITQLQRERRRKVAAKKANKGK